MAEIDWITELQTWLVLHSLGGPIKEDLGPNFIPHIGSRFWMIGSTWEVISYNTPDPVCQDDAVSMGCQIVVHCAEVKEGFHITPKEIIRDLKIDGVLYKK